MILKINYICFQLPECKLCTNFHNVYCFQKKQVKKKCFRSTQLFKQFTVQKQNLHKQHFPKSLMSYYFLEGILQELQFSKRQMRYSPHPP